MKTYKKFFFIFWLSTFFFIPTFAQPANSSNEQADLKFDHIGLEQGLSQSTVNAIVQDAQGFMWFGTQDGLNRYDGYTINILRHNPKDSNSVSDNRINCLLSDSKNDLWIGTENGGLDRYVLAEGKFYHFLNDENDPLTISNNTITSLFEDSQANIWVGTNSGLSRYNRKDISFSNFFFNTNTTEGLNDNAIRAICEDNDANIWVGTYKGLFRYNLKSGQNFIRVDELNTNPTTLYGDNVTSLYLDQNGLLWIGTYDQFLKSYNKNTNSFDSYRNTIKNIKSINEDSENNLWLGSINMSLRILNLKSNKVTQIQAIQNDPINTMYVDNCGLLWLGTSFRGIFIYNRNKNRFKHYLNYPNDPNNPNVVMTLIEDKDGGLWVGTYGNGLKYFDSKRDIVKTYRHEPPDPNSISSDKIFTLCLTTDGVLWVGTIGGGLNYFDRSTGVFKKYLQNSPIDTKGLSNNDITALYENSDGNLLIGNVMGGIDILNRKTKTFSHFYPEVQIPNTIGGGRSVTVIRKDRKGTLWAGTLNGLKQFDKKLNKFIHCSLEQKSSEQNGNSESVTSLLFTEQFFWIGTSQNGLIRYHPESNTSISYTADDGLPDNVILGILPDSWGNLWLSTNKGISRFNPRSEKFKNYDINDGLQGKEFNQGAYFKSSIGEMFFGGVNGFNAFFPDKIEKNNFIPPVYFTAFTVFNEKLLLPNPVPNNYTIELSYNQNFFSIEFVALNFSSPEKNKYAYMLEDFDRDWHNVSSKQRYASYTNLDPGEYVLRVKGSNNDGIWNKDGAIINIIINPPFWMTWWFRSLGILLFISLGFIVYQRRITTLKKDKALQQEISRRLIEKQEEERSRIALEMHDSLGQDLLLIKNRLMLTIKKNSEQFPQPDSEDSNLKNYKLNTFQELNQISEDISGVLKTVREISHNLRPPDLDQLGLTETIQSILLAMRESTSIKVTGKVENIDEVIPKDLEINFVRIVQEALGNVIKHADASECNVEVLYQNNHLYLEISDNGKGFDLINRKDTGKKSEEIHLSSVNSGLGLTGMSERVRILGGIFRIITDLGKGTRIVVEIPVNKTK